MEILKNIDILNDILGKTGPIEALQWLSEHSSFNVTFSTSFGQEDQVITDMIFKNDLDVNVFTLDTGRLFQETYDVHGLTLKKYKKSIDVFYPLHESVESMIKEKGPNSFYDSIENRKQCCNIRKIEPLSRALKPFNVWVTGLRSTQSKNRSLLKRFQYDPKFDIIKFNPILDWNLEEVEKYLDTHRVPQNRLHKKGYISIGCEPCTRAISPGEDIRAGRWWWETSKKECGLHS
ncbi:phosphoadenylyl-sulfate reductase [Membranihabitans maritimus]|uniref:phosphoadenylyl-sulfate reductase n=1 Tax=Membranihabitans maritimus TaxID=2904244 RepID=UPI001F02622B|nr:phosphoadenylyl-sulfate reductase [Membranihabitans maritimus]